MNTPFTRVLAISIIVILSMSHFLLGQDPQPTTSPTAAPAGPEITIKGVMLLEEATVLTEEQLKEKLTAKMGTPAGAPERFHAFDDLEENVRRQVNRVKSHPWIPKHIPVRGFVYDVKTGKLSEVEQ